MELDRIYPNYTVGSVGATATLGILHRFSIRPDEIVRIHQVAWWSTGPKANASGRYVGYALSFDNKHDQNTGDLNMDITDTAIMDNNRVWARAQHIWTQGAAGGGYVNVPIIIPFPGGYDIGRSVIALFFNAGDGARFFDCEILWQPVRVGTTMAQQMNLRRAVQERGKA